MTNKPTKQLKKIYIWAPALALAILIAVYFLLSFTRTVEPASTTVTSDDGIVTLEIPDGALPDDVVLADIKIAKDDPSALFTAEEGDEYFYKLEPDGLKFSSPATITYEIKAGEDYSSPLLFSISEDGDSIKFEITEKQTTVIDPEKDIMKVSGEISHFSWSYLNRGVRFVKFTPASETTIHKVGDQFNYKGIYSILYDKEYTFEYSLGDKIIFYVNKDKYSTWDISTGLLQTWHRFIIMPDEKKIESHNKIKMTEPYSFLASFKCAKAGEEKIEPQSSGLDMIYISYSVSIRLIDKEGRKFTSEWAEGRHSRSEVLSAPENHSCVAAEKKDDETKKDEVIIGGGTGSETLPPAEKPGLTVTGDNYRLVCADGKVYTGAIAKCPVKHVPIKDAKGNYTDSKTGKVIACP